MTFKIVQARYSMPGAYDRYATRLVSADALAESGPELAFYFERTSEIAEISVTGEIRVEGDEHLLGDSYLED